MVRLVRSLLACVALASIATAADVPCTLSDASGFYDLRGLQRTDGDYGVVNGEEVYALNFCGSIKTSTWAIDKSELVGSYLEGARGGISLGQFNTTPSYHNGVLSMQYLSGSVCPNSSAKRSTTIHLQCDNSWSAGVPQYVGSVEDCAYFFSFKTPYACPTSVAASVGGFVWVFLSFVFLAIVVSFLSAVVYNRLVLKLRGTDQFPSIDRIKSAGEFLKDMFIISSIAFLDFLQSSFSKLSSMRQPRSSSSDYTRGTWSQSARDGFERRDTESGPILGEDEDDEDEEEGMGYPTSGFSDDKR